MNMKARIDQWLSVPREYTARKKVVLAVILTAMICLMLGIGMTERMAGYDQKREDRGAAAATAWAKPQRGELISTSVLGGYPVQYVASIELEDGTVLPEQIIPASDADRKGTQLVYLCTAPANSWHFCEEGEARVMPLNSQARPWDNEARYQRSNFGVVGAIGDFVGALLGTLFNPINLMILILVVSGVYLFHGNFRDRHKAWMDLAVLDDTTVAQVEEPH